MMAIEAFFSIVALLLGIAGLCFSLNAWMKANDALNSLNQIREYRNSYRNCYRETRNDKRDHRRTLS